MVPHRRILGGGVTCKMRGREGVSARSVARPATPAACARRVATRGKGCVGGVRACAPPPQAPFPGDFCAGVRGECWRRGGETGRRGGGGRGVCYRQHPHSQSSGRASSCPPSPPQQQPTVAPSFWCACWWATRKRACGWASTMAPSETTSRHRTPARAAASGMRASYRQDRLSSSCPEFDFRAARKYITTWV